MTIEEHIENLKIIASDMPSDKCSDWIESLMAVVKALEQNPCVDCISRQAAINAIGNVPDYDDGMVWEALSHAQRDVALLPSVTPRQKIENAPLSMIKSIREKEGK